jgi:hypothetical protein
LAIMLFIYQDVMPIALKRYRLLRCECQGG